MNYVNIINGIAVSTLSSADYHAQVQAGQINLTDPKWQSRWEWHSFERVCDIAEQLTAVTGEQWAGTDAGEYCSPRYDIVKVPKVGDKVSYGFNGDCYPVGVIKSVSKSLRAVITIDEHGNTKRFNRRRMTGAWVNHGWSLIGGHVDKRNPHF